MNSKKGKFKKFLLTGGSGFMFGTEKSEAVLARELLIRLGVPDEDIIVEPDSKNTFENALFTKKILAEKKSLRQELNRASTINHSTFLSLVSAIINKDCS